MMARWNGTLSWKRCAGSCALLATLFVVSRAEEEEKVGISQTAAMVSIYYEQFSLFLFFFFSLSRFLRERLEFKS